MIAKVVIVEIDGVKFKLMIEPSKQAFTERDNGRRNVCVHVETEEFQIDHTQISLTKDKAL